MGKRPISRKRPAKKSKACDLFTEPLEERSFCNRFVVLSTKYSFTDLPQHPLAIPSGWARRIDGDFSLDDCDLCDREMAIGRCSTENRAIMADNDDVSLDNIKELYWSLVFELGDVESGSWLTIEGGCATQLMIDTSVSLVRPTAEEMALHELCEEHGPGLCMCRFKDSDRRKLVSA